jgi:hypothetical protein
MKYSRSGTGAGMSENTIERGAAEMSLAFGSTIRRRRKALNMRQDELALATGVGRFLSIWRLASQRANSDVAFSSLMFWGLG